MERINHKIDKEFKLRDYVTEQNQKLLILVRPRAKILGKKLCK
jgi:hypothetical protein